MSAVAVRLSRFARPRRWSGSERGVNHLRVPVAGVWVVPGDAVAMGGEHGDRSDRVAPRDSEGRVAPGPGHRHGAVSPRGEPGDRQGRAVVERDEICGGVRGAPHTERVRAGRYKRARVHELESARRIAVDLGELVVREVEPGPLRDAALTLDEVLGAHTVDRVSVGRLRASGKCRVRVIAGEDATGRPGRGPGVALESLEALITLETLDALVALGPLVTLVTLAALGPLVALGPLAAGWKAFAQPVELDGVFLDVRSGKRTVPDVLAGDLDRRV